MKFGIIECRIPDIVPSAAVKAIGKPARKSMTDPVSGMAVPPDGVSTLGGGEASVSYLDAALSPGMERMSEDSKSGGVIPVMGYRRWNPLR